VTKESFTSEEFRDVTLVYFNALMVGAPSFQLATADLDGGWSALISPAFFLPLGFCWDFAGIRCDVSTVHAALHEFEILRLAQ
jgi:hypothetical protein